MHDGSLGWRRAQERDLIAGWAEEVIGARCEIERGKVLVAEGKRIGDTNGLQVPDLACWL